MEREVTSEDYANLPTKLYELLDEMGCAAHQWDKGREIGKEVGVPAAHRVLAYLDCHEDIEWVRCRAYWTLARLYDVNPMAIVAEEFNNEQRMIDAMHPLKRWWLYRRPRLVGAYL